MAKTFRVADERQIIITCADYRLHSTDDVLLLLKYVEQSVAGRQIIESQTWALKAKRMKSSQSVLHIHQGL